MISFPLHDLTCGHAWFCRACLCFAFEGKLLEWLVDRKKMPADWHGRLTALQARAAAAAAKLPSGLPPAPLAAEIDAAGGLDYLRCRAVRDAVAVSEGGGGGGLFSRGPLGEWDALLKAYEKVRRWRREG